MEPMGRGEERVGEMGQSHFSVSTGEGLDGIVEK
jgi:hypothetical protein